jgi:hypothetical protein
MSEKKIYLSDVEVGDKLWSVRHGETTCQDVRIDHPEYHIVTPAGIYTNSGKYYVDDKFPTLFHSREEFLEFHDIAPVRMTRKEIRQKYELLEDYSSSFEIMLQGFSVAGGQIIEEPKNLPCFVCGKDVMIPNDSSPEYLLHKENGCILSDYMFLKNVWNDPSKRGKV